MEERRGKVLKDKERNGNRTHVYEFLNALKEVRNGILKGLLSAMSWHVT